MKNFKCANGPPEHQGGRSAWPRRLGHHLAWISRHLFRVPGFSFLTSLNLKIYTRHLGVAVVLRLFKMGPKMVERRLKTVRRLLHPLLVEMCAMLKNVTTLIQFQPRQEVCDAYLRRRQFFGARSAEIFEGICPFSYRIS